MTECERIKQSNIVPESFFEPEILCDFYVDENRKKIWAIELDMLLKFDSVCKKYHLTYYLTDGSLLGAIRHGGFIPWDDDIDVSMPRADYEKLQSLTGEFKYPYFLQTPKTDEGYFFSFIKLRNSNTTGMSKSFMFQGFNNGLSLDIFPMDKVSSGAEDYYLKIYQLIKGNSAVMKLSNPYLTDKELNELKKEANKNPMEAYEKINEIAKMYAQTPTGYISHWVSAFDPFEKKVWKEEDFATTVLHEFNGYMIPIPVGYDDYLRTYFGDYMTLPSMEQRINVHRNAILDPDKPYTYYINKAKRKISGKVGITVGVFDLFHVGHLNLLEKCRAKCDYLIVGLCMDDYVRQIKKKEPIIGESDRQRILNSLECVDEVIPLTLEEIDDKMICLKNHPFDILFSGDDWKNSERYNRTEKQFAELGVSIVYLPYTKGISTTIIKERMSSN